MSENAVKIAKMAKFDEKTRFLRDGEAGNVRKNVRKRLENARKWSREVRIFQKVTAGVSLVKQSVRQNEMGGALARFVISSQWLSCVPVSTFWH